MTNETETETVSRTPGPYDREDKLNPEMITGGKCPNGHYIYLASVEGWCDGDVEETGDSCNYVQSSEEAEANAEFILLAMNTHDRLVETLKNQWGRGSGRDSEHSVALLMELGVIEESGS